MDQVREKDNQQLVDIGVCQKHNRLYECYCTICYCLICPSCLMFDDHKGHPVCRIEQGSKSLRARISQSSKQGILKFQKTENVLLDIRHAKLTLEQNKQKIIKQSQTMFDQLINNLKNRKARFLAELNAHFDKELQVVNQNEQKWIKRQEVSQQILQLQKSNDDLKLIESAKLIATSLDEFKLPLKYNSVNIISGLKTNLDIGKHSIVFRDLLQSTNNFMKKGDNIVNQYKA